MRWWSIKAADVSLAVVRVELTDKQNDGDIMTKRQFSANATRRSVSLRMQALPMIELSSVC
ncbi:hypothetical protein DOTSEDRAFT_74405 [Dothistroma septosporum NZE10]|uniref:Uncharacterized protein n=1 Tax=Dothistroma septosporum (strain NZE10 / CBS 128990) TaxID=675120 RepID=N1PDZ1_DOTSN|nr:hypothetical protein DOTSEDRAFT_74405 [Dothistroma septosporum NZE10]